MSDQKETQINVRIRVICCNIFTGVLKMRPYGGMHMLISNVLSRM